MDSYASHIASGVLLMIVFFLGVLCSGSFWGQKHEKEQTPAVQWIVEMECGQYVTFVPDFDDWLLKNQDKKIVTVEWVHMSNHVGYYIVYLVKPGRGVLEGME